MSLAACCSPDAMFITQSSIAVWGIVGIACGALLILEALAIAILLRNRERRFWRRKFVVATALIGAGMCIGASWAFAAYATIRDKAPLTPSDISTIVQWEGFGNLALGVTIFLVFAGASYVWLVRDHPSE